MNIKYYLITIALLITSIAFFQHAQESSIPQLFNTTTMPHTSITVLLNAFKISHNNTLESIVEGTQKEWLRKPGKERWQVDNIFSPQTHSLIMHECDKLGMLQEIKPQSKKYDYALVLGGTVERTRSRFAHLLQLINQGYSFNSILFLCGQRPLDKTIENDEILLDFKNSALPTNNNWKKPTTLPTTETEMTQMVIDQTLLSENVKEKIRVIDTPCKVGPGGSLIRPTTGDTFASWLSTSAQPGSVLVISSQPYVGYQDTVARTFLPKEFTCETVGAAYENDESDAILLDTLARWIYQTKQLVLKS